MDKGQGKVAAQLPFPDVELLGQQSRRAARCAVALEPGSGLDGATELLSSERNHESAEQERPFGLLERPSVVAETVHIAVTGEIGDDLFEGGAMTKSVGEVAPRSPGSRRAASTLSSSGSRCQRPLG